MGLWRRVVNRGRLRRYRPMEVETVEGRVLLSGVATFPAVKPPSGEIVVANAEEARAWNSAGRSAPAGKTTTAAVVQGGQDAVTDAWNGYWLVHSKNVANLGYRYAKLSLAHNTRTVTGAFIKAALRGDGKTIDQLSHTNAARKVADEFSRLSSSPGVKYVGDQFAHFGRGVADQASRIFGGGSAAKTPKRHA